VREEEAKVEEAVKSENAHLKSIEQLHVEKKDLIQQVQAYKDETEKAKRDLEDHLASFESQKQDIIKQMESQKAENEQLTQQVIDISRQMHEAEEKFNSQLKGKDTELLEVQTEFTKMQNSLESQLRTQQEHLNKLKENIASEHQQNIKLSQQLTDLEEEFKERIDELDEHIGMQQNEIFSKSTEIHELVTTLELEKDKNKRVEANSLSLKSRLENRITELEKLLQGDVDPGQDKMLGQLKLERELNKNLQKEVQETNERLGKRIASLQEQLDVLSKQKDGFQSQSSDNFALFEGERRRNQALQKKYSQLKKHASKKGLLDNDETTGVKFDVPSLLGEDLQRKCLTPNINPKGVNSLEDTLRKQSLSSLSVSEVGDLLEHLQLGQYKEQFKENKVDGAKLSAIYLAIESGDVSEVEKLKMDVNHLNLLKEFIQKADDVGISSQLVDDNNCILM